MSGNAKRVRRTLVRLAGSHQRKGVAFRCAVILEVERGLLSFGEALGRCLWGQPAKTARRVPVRIPKSLRRYFPNGLQVLS